MRQSLTFILLAFSAIAGANAQPAKDSSGPERRDTTVVLDEVVVTAAQEQTRIDGDGMLTKIQGTILQNLGTAKDVLGYIPGVLNNNGSIEVFGKGVPVFYINGRRMRNPLELDQLKSYQLKEVKVITTPGARYDSGTNAVIRITTVKNPGEGFALDTRTTGGYRDCLYGSEQINLNYRTGGLDIFGILHYDYSESKGSSRHTQNTWQTTHSQSDLASEYKDRRQMFDGQAGFNYTAVSGHAFGAYYQGLGKYNRESSTSDARFLTDGTALENSAIDNNDKTDHYQHLVDAYYSGKWSKWTADIALNYLWRTGSDTQAVTETPRGGEPLRLDFLDRNRGRMLAAEINLARPVWRGVLDLGASFTDSRRSDACTNPDGVIADSDNTIKETAAGVYAQTTQNFGPVMVQAGLRYEYIGNRYFENGIKMPGQSRDYNEILPSATIVVPIKKTALQLSYSRKYSRPLYSQLSSSVHYSNEYLYETGNPSLKSTYTDALSLNFKYRWLIVMANYRHVRNRVISVSEDYGGNPEITLLKKINSPNAINSLEVMATAAPGLVGKFYYPVLMGGVISQFYDVDYRGRTQKMDSPIGIVRLNNLFRLPSNFMVAANFSWRGSGDSDNMTIGQSWQIDIAATKTFNSNWDVKLSISDILNTARHSSFTMYSGVRDMHVDKISCRRSIEVAVGYRFNVPKSKYKGKGAGNSEKDRF